MLFRVGDLQRALTGFDDRRLKLLTRSLAGFRIQCNVGRAARGSKGTSVALFRHGKGNGRGSAR
jgi:hypothetical protein